MLCKDWTGGRDRCSGTLSTVFRWHAGGRVGGGRCAVVSEPVLDVGRYSTASEVRFAGPRGGRFMLGGVNVSRAVDQQHRNV